MDARTPIEQAYGFSQMVLSSYVNDLTDAELLTRPGEGCNHIAWQLGHLIASEIQLLESIVPGHAVTLPEGFAAKHSKENIDSDDPSDFATKDEYLRLFNEVKEATFAALQSQTAADLAQPAPEFLASMCPNRCGVFVLIATHAMMHVGQFVPVRRKLGKPVVI
jgi:hypothetical protein